MKHLKSLSLRAKFVLYPICLFSMCLVSASAFAVEIDRVQWQSIETAHKQPIGAKIIALQQTLDSAEDIYKASQQIKIMTRQTTLKAQHLHQLTKWRRVEAVIDIPSEDHPGQFITIVNIAAEAKAAINGIKSRSAASSLYDKWQSNSFIFNDLATFTGLSGQGTFLSFFNRLPPFLQEGFTDWSVDQLREQHKTASSDYNFVLYHLANRSQRLDVARYLLAQPVNEVSHRFLSTLTQYFDADAQLTILTLAADNPKMRSQSFNALAQHFATDASAALLIANALQHKDAYWSALTVVPAFVNAGNVEAFNNVKKQLVPAQQKQLDMRLMRAN